MFANQSALAVDDLKQYAAELAMDSAAFASCLDDGQMRGLVQQDINQAQLYGISSTPTLFINGRMVSGAQPFETFERIILDELARQ